MNPVFMAPTKSLWLLLADLDTSTVWFNLETAEVRDLNCSLAYLMTYGWREVTESDAGRWCRVD